MKKKILLGFIVCLLFVGCQFDTGKNEESEKDTYKLSIVWSDYAGIVAENEDVRKGKAKIFIADYIYGTKETKIAEELADLNDYFYDIDLSKYDSEYKEKMGLGEKNLEKETVFKFDVNERYIYDSDPTINLVYICSFTYYSDEGLTDKIDSVVMDSDKTVYAKAYYDYTNVANWDTNIVGKGKSRFKE